MKKPILSLCLAAVIVFTGCTKEDHAIRVTNEYHEGFSHLSIDEITFNSIGPGSTTEYKSVAAGEFNISGHTTGNQVLSGSGKVGGKGKHRWSLIVASDGTLNFREDK
jgi:hypothetical protein